MSDQAFDYLTSNTDKQVLKNLAVMGEHLKALKLALIKAQAEAEHAQKEYDYYAGTVLPMEMFNSGVEEIKLMSGGIMKYERKFYCNPNKNDEDKRLMAAWLQEHGGGNLIKEKAIVDGSQVERLVEAEIPFVEIDDINTNSLKAFLKDKIGANGGMVQVQIQDIPACMHFQEVGQVSIDI